MDVQGAARVLARGLAALGLPVHAPPAPHDALDMGGRAAPPNAEQPPFRLRGRHACQGADLGIRELPAAERLGQSGERPQGARNSNAFARRTQVEPHSPAQPGRAGAKSGVPSAARVELANQVEEAGGGGLEVRRQLGDVIAQSVQIGTGPRSSGDVWREHLHGEPSFC